jgi:hypothetical protein
MTAKEYNEKRKTKKIIELFNSSEKESTNLAIEKLCRYQNDDFSFAQTGKQKQLTFTNGRVSALREVVNILRDE